MYYPCGENKGADQLRSYCEADLRLCFRIRKNPVFSWRGSNICKNLQFSVSMNAGTTGRFQNDQVDVLFPYILRTSIVTPSTCLYRYI